MRPWNPWALSPIPAWSRWSSVGPDRRMKVEETSLEILGPRARSLTRSPMPSEGWDLWWSVVSAVCEFCGGPWWS